MEVLVFVQNISIKASSSTVSLLTNQGIFQNPICYWMSCPLGHGNTMLAVTSPVIQYMGTCAHTQAPFGGVQRGSTW